MKTKKIVIAMSGGVDSSVAAALLKEQGHEVIGMMLRLWSEPGKDTVNRCCTPDDVAIARRIAAQLDIPFYAIDAKDEFYQAVVNTFINGYTQGITPNPCLVCNRQIRWGFLLDRALALGADCLATGHYARLSKEKENNQQTDNNNPLKLLRAVDSYKDQSYVLHVLNQEQLSHASFPLGELTKTQVRELAQRFSLPIARRSDSQDLCFLGNSDYRTFLIRNFPEVVNPGPIRNPSGELIGQHEGLAFYTIGQRRGLGVTAPHPLYVIRKDNKNNTLIIGEKEELGRYKFSTSKVNWISGKVPQGPLYVSIKIRYRSQDVGGIVTPITNGGSEIQLEKPLNGVTPGQAAVFYDGDHCLGGGIIE